MQTKSVRLPESLIAEVRALGGDHSFSEVLTEAVIEWIKRKRREREDEIIVRSLSQRSPEQRAEEASLVTQAEQSARRILESLDG